MKVMDTKRLRLLVALSLLGGLLALSPFSPAKANPSAWCYDDVDHPSVVIFSGTYVWLAIENGTLDGTPGHVALCYATGAPGNPKTIGGAADVNVVPRSDGADVQFGNHSDTNSANQVNFSAYTTPTYSLSPGGTGGGQSLTFTIPVVVCSGPCQPTAQPADGTSGVIVGTISQTPTSSGGSSAAYGLTGLCIQVDGATVVGNCTTRFGDAGATTTGTSPVNSNPTTPGPCLLSLCAPNYEYIGTTGNQLGTVYIPGLGPIPVSGVHTCVYQKDSATPCPY